MQGSITQDTVVSFDYELHDDAGRLVDSSEAGRPMTYLHGHGQIVPGLEKALAGRRAGETLKVVVAPAEGYGERNPERRLQLPRAELPEGLDPAPGIALHAVGPDGREAIIWVESVEGDLVNLSFDHPLAGVTLTFDVQIRSVRAATRQELAHGHAHGAHGHDH
jgi:FKBP-type peptidyl-prolyl cis-trans isomerase SlyD